jgi:methylthioribose-1-phosphate isomerase
MRKAIYFYKNRLRILDQSVNGGLPNNPQYRELKSYKEVILAIKELKVRGAPLIGVVGAYGLVLALNSQRTLTRDKLLEIASEISAARPTAINLTWALERLTNIIKNPEIKTSLLPKVLLKEARTIEKEEEERSYQIGKIGASIIKNNYRIITICNTGWLAAPGIGTALGVIYTAYRQKKKVKVYVLETRPLLQGARLTAYELTKAKIPYVLITDNMMGTVMKEVDLVLVGADRIARNGDTANKIGTLTLAITAHYYQKPFYVAAPTSSFDFTKRTGGEIPIEERSPDEVRLLRNIPIAPKNAPIYNPAFDITPHNLITGFITEKGMFTPETLHLLNEV